MVLNILQNFDTILDDLFIPVFILLEPTQWLVVAANRHLSWVFEQSAWALYVAIYA